ncbi:hypothetical protein [Haloquadratum walsbyi]|jgi:hypothetical protein|uniref:Uncharacterized protein n=1 Tax=Haloquadratum walsbyi J07HQW2 TaxID=1238425 RepID=U1MVM3_9EURY|nr:hypothetical protein [Haloquadratum walsbyi]ERG94444.1 MAG: hypothetical protein J07HQW2_00878 [Haloquadratum walsbyi J07HQW2]
MYSVVVDILFDEPRGYPISLIHFGGSVTLSALIIYTWITGHSISGGSVVMLIGVTITGIAESLPADHRQIAGVLRLGAIFMFLSLAVMSLFVPEVILEFGY